MTRRTVTVASPAGASAELTPAADRLLRNLEARVYLARPCWLIPYGSLDGSLWSLLVPVDYSKHPERLRALRNGTVAGLERYGLVQLGPAGQPVPLYSYRHPRDCTDDRALTVTLTALGRQRLSAHTLELEAAALAAQEQPQ